MRHVPVAPGGGVPRSRHTFASLHVASGTNVVQLSRLLGHHSPAFTLRVYVHLIPGDEPAPLDLDAELALADGSRAAAVHAVGAHSGLPGAPIAG